MASFYPDHRGSSQRKTVVIAPPSTLSPCFPDHPDTAKGRPWVENRRVLKGILWILRSGSRWQDNYPHPSTC
ncbi:MAG: transposase [Candidatus Acidiferrales bacterium]